MAVNIQKLLTKLDISVHPKESNSDNMMTNLLPFVSAKNPLKCDDAIIPAYATELTIPLSSVLKSRSFSATGSTNEMLRVSNSTADNTTPLIITIK